MLQESCNNQCHTTSREYYQLTLRSMNKTLITIGVGIALAAIPFVSSAQTITATVGSATGNPVAISSGPMCPSIARSLYIGVRGSDVTSLQQFLAAHGYLKVSPTGYFGLLTQTAVGHWQAEGGVAASGSAGYGIFGPLSRAFFIRSCGSVTQSQNFTATPLSGSAPLTVQFTSTAPQGTNIGTAINFGDGSSGTLAFAPTCASCNALATASHTYTSNGSYAATLTSSTGATLGMIRITVGPGSGTTGIKQVTVPATVSLALNEIAEVRNESSYFTLTTLTSSTATVQLTGVGCWNSFPSDTPPEVRCMIAIMPTAPQTLSVGQAYNNGNYTIKLTDITNGIATFVLTASASAQ